MRLNCSNTKNSQNKIEITNASQVLTVSTSEVLEVLSSSLKYF